MRKETTTKKPQHQLLQSIIDQRSFLIKNNLSHKNKTACLVIIKKIQTYIDAHSNKYTFDGWNKMIMNNFHDIEFLIPNNVAGETIKNKLYALLK